jgi:anti-anti-sigma factor
MTCEVEVRGDFVQIRGEMTIYNAAAVKDELLAALGDPAGCRIDLAAVSEFDTTGLQLLLMAQRACVARGAPFSLMNPSATVREALELLQAKSLRIVSDSVSPA